MALLGDRLLRKVQATNHKGEQIPSSVFATLQACSPDARRSQYNTLLPPLARDDASGFLRCRSVAAAFDAADVAALSARRAAESQLVGTCAAALRAERVPLRRLQQLLQLHLSSPASAEVPETS